MNKKVTAPAPKGQTSLFSFFRKPAAGSEAPPKDLSPPKEKEKDDMTNPLKRPLVETQKAKKPVAESDEAKKRRKTVIYDDDDDSDAQPVSSQPNSNSKSSIPVTSEKPKAGAEAKEDEWDEMSVAEEESEEENSNDDFVNDSDGDENDDDQSDGLFNSDSEEEISRRKPDRASKQLGKKKIAPKKAVALTPARVLIPHEAKPSLITPSVKSASWCATPAPASASSSAMASGRSTEEAYTPSANLNLPEGVVGRGSHEHNGFKFLHPDSRKDAQGHKVDNPLFNPRTLQVTPQFQKEQTPAMQQWWLFKAHNMDTVLFFKVGKFYELFHMDADVGFAELDLIYMKGLKAHSGFPEVSYGKFASALVAKGYRVARVEQTETPDMLKERNDTSKGKKDKVVAREMCSIMSRGTRTYCHLDDLSLLDGGDPDANSSVLLCIKEALTETEGEGDPKHPEYGICLVDTVLGTLTLAQFQDDLQRSRLRTLLARYRPTEVILQAGGHSPHTLGAVQLMVPRAAMEYLRGEEMPSGSETFALLHKGRYFGAKAAEGSGSMRGWPAVVKAVHAGLEDGTSECVVAALGGALWQLRRSLIDYEVLSLGKVFAYIPPDEQSGEEEEAMQVTQIQSQTQSQTQTQTQSQTQSLFSPADQENHQVTFDSEGGAEAGVGAGGSGPVGVGADELKIMTLDEVALTNLEILVNNYDRTEKGSMWAFLNRTKTAPGRRLMRSWLCRPLYRPADIARRQDAVADLLGDLGDVAESARHVLKSVPDVERLLTRVHSNGIKRAGHPESRAIFYENYNVRKIKDLADVLAGFDTVLRASQLFDNLEVASPLLRLAVCSAKRGGKFPQEEVRNLLAHFREIFDEKLAKKEGNIRPRPGMDADYDDARADTAQCEADLEAYLREVKKQLGVNDLKYWGTNKDRYQIEVPMAHANKVPNNWTSKSQKKTHRRYWTPKVEQLLERLLDAEEKLGAAQKDMLRRVFAKFDASFAVWSAAVSCVALLDALLSLATVSSFPNYVRPEVYAPKGACPELEILGGRHPMLEFSLLQRGDGDCIPNDLVLGGAAGGVYQPKMLMLSGPNMGGKSTLLRQTCLITVLAQVGCWVPADTCRMTPVDRIFTRVGASDRILAGQSTFFVELAETATILNAASRHSLCILDELGRGTATFDGTAIAHAVVEHIVGFKHCRALFATHYHSLVNDWELDPRVRLGHMSCLVNEEGGGERTERELAEEVTFLYKLAEGSSPRSYGINVARLAGLPDAVIQLALQQSREFEARMAGKAAAQAAAQAGGVSSPGASGGGLGRRLGSDQVSRVFDRLVSLAGSTSNIAELAWVAAEFWDRVTALEA